ncbi:hypothetical protein WN51_07680 [Melipona quadrifasciata]|uniref:Uncharacterized protein n=1 Tax=Melipona quadrifasciata TaxID=166423 RepID=A0A0M8ZPD8_9HYME|nr:hypothetical protein WN51_07680 [Melipona quadrifasciata]
MEKVPKNSERRSTDILRKIYNIYPIEFSSGSTHTFTINSVCHTRYLLRLHNFCLMIGTMSGFQGTQPRVQYKHSHDVDPGYSIGRVMRQSSKISHGPDHKHHQITRPAFRPLEGKGHSESQGIKELIPMR